MIRYITYTFFILLSFVSCKTNQEVLKESAKGDVRDESVFIEGVRQRLLGNNELALGYFHAFLLKFPQSSASYYNLAMIYFASGNYDLAYKNALLAKKIRPDNIAYNLLYIDCSIQTNRLDDAFATYDTILKLQPENSDNWMEYLDLLFRFNYFDRALLIIHNFEKYFGTTIFSLRYKYRVFVGLHDLDSVENTLLSLHRKLPEKVDYTGSLAEFYIGQKKYDKAQHLYDELLKMNVPLGNIYLSMANFARIRGQKKDELKYFLKALPDTTLSLAKKLHYFRLMRKNHEFSDSVLYHSLLPKINSVYPKDAALLLMQAKYLLSKQNYKEALALLKSIVDLAPGDFNSWQLLLNTELNLNNYELLYEDANRALELFPNQANIYLYSGIGALRSDRQKEAASILENGLSYVFDKPKLEFQFTAYLGDIYNSLKNYQKSDYYFNRAIFLDSTNWVLKNNYAYYLSLRGEKLQLALSMIKSVLNTTPDNYVYLDTYAWILFKMGNFAAAQLWEKKSLLNGGDSDTDVLSHYVAILKSLGQMAEAEKFQLEIKRLE